MTATLSLDDALRASGLLRPDEIERADQLARERGIPLPRAVVALGLLAEDQFLEIAAETAGLDVASPTEESVDPELVRRIPIEELERFTALPVALGEDGTLIVAFAERPSSAVLARLSKHAGSKICPVLASAPRLRRILGRLDGDWSESPRRAASQDPTGVTAFYRHLTSGLSVGATEIRFEPSPDALRIRYRRHGVLRVVETEPPEIAPAVAARARMVAELGSSDGVTPQSATRRMRLSNRSARFELSIVPVRDGELVIVRALPWVEVPHTLAEWKIEGDAAAWFRREFVTPGVVPAWVRVDSEDAELRDEFARATALAADAAGLAVAWHTSNAPAGPWTVVTDAASLAAAHPDVVIVHGVDVQTLNARGGLSADARVLVVGSMPHDAQRRGAASALVAEVICSTSELPDRTHTASAIVSSTCNRRP